jgi:signal transduction histidine kinase
MVSKQRQMIHQHPRFQNTPIVFVSGIHGTDMDRLKGYQHGAIDYVSVPVVPELLRAKVKAFAELHRKTKQLETLNAQMTVLQDEERRYIARELHDSLGQHSWKLTSKILQIRGRPSEESAKGSEEYERGSRQGFFQYAPCGHTVYLGHREVEDDNFWPELLRFDNSLLTV